MAKDDFRIRVELPQHEPHGFLEKLGIGLGEEAAELARELKQHRLAVSNDEDTVFVYSDSPQAAGIARQVVLREVERHGVEAEVSEVERWIDGEDRWSSDPPGEGWEEEHVERDIAPWEVRIEASSHDEAERIANGLQAEGYEPVRRWKYVIVGVASEDEAKALAARTHGTVELGGGVVYEVTPQNPFAIFG